MQIYEEGTLTNSQYQELMMLNAFWSIDYQYLFDGAKKLFNEQHYVAKNDLIGMDVRFHCNDVKVYTNHFLN